MQNTGIFQDMYFIGRATTFSESSDNIDIATVWNFRSKEFSTDGQQIRALLESLDPPDNGAWKNTKWTCQALLEFQDLQSMVIPKKGRFFNSNFLFFEGLTILREAVLCGINGQIHASFAALRSGLEAITTHYWWKEKAFSEKDFTLFYDWLIGNSKGLPQFRGILEKTFRDVALPSEILTFDEVYELYKKLCSYAHKPTKAESLTGIRRTNVTVPNLEQTKYWLWLTYGSLSSLLIIMVGRDPICLFPVDWYRKFGFSPPVGTFFDKSNFVPLQKAFSGDLINKMRSHYQERELPKTTLDWFYSQPDRDDEAILASWVEEDPIERDADTFEGKVELRLSLLKAKMRTFHLAFAYGDGGPELPDFESLLRGAVDGDP